MPFASVLGNAMGGHCCENIIMLARHSQAMLSVQAIASVDREEMFAEHMKERERRKRADEKAARKRKLQDFRELLERTSDIKVSLRHSNHEAMAHQNTCFLERVSLLAQAPIYAVQNQVTSCWHAT